MFLLLRCIAQPRLKSSEMLPSQAWGEGKGRVGGPSHFIQLRPPLFIGCTVHRQTRMCTNRKLASPECLRNDAMLDSSKSR